LSVLVNGTAVASGPNTWTYHDDPATPSIEFQGSLCSSLMESNLTSPVDVEIRAVQTL
jgi:hypothetical protein